MHVMNRMPLVVTTVAVVMVAMVTSVSAQPAAPTTAPSEGAWLLIGRGDDAFNQGNLDAARQLYEQASTAASDDTVAQVRAIRCLAGVELQAGNLKVSIDHLQRAKDVAEKASLKGSEWIGLLDQLANVLYWAREYDKSVEVRAQIVEATEAEVLRARFFHAHSTLAAGEVDRAMEIYKQCFAAAEAKQDKDSVLWAITCLMYAEMSREKYEDALHWAEQRLQRAPDGSFGYVTRGYVHLATGQWEAAAANLERAVEMEPFSYWPLYLWISKVRQGNVEEATERLRSDLVKGDLLNVESVGETRLQVYTWILDGMKGSPPLPRPANAGTLDDEYSEMCYLAGQGLLQIGRRDEAVALFKEAVHFSDRLGPSSSCAAAELKRLEAAAK